MEDKPGTKPNEREAEAPEDRPGEPGAEGGSKSGSASKLPGMPSSDDDTPLGDTDQHSNA